MTVFRQVVQGTAIEKELKEVLTRAREALENAGLSETERNDAADELAKITEELQTPEPNGKRIKRGWTIIQGNRSRPRGS